MRQHQTVKQLLVRIFVVISLTLLAAQFISAQTTTSASHGFSPGKSYAISDIETIGLYNGNLMLNVPLGSLPAGRGGISSGVSLRYDSKIWDLFEFDFERFGQSWQGQTLGNSLEGGWQYSYKYGLKLAHRPLGPMEADCTSGNVNSFYPHKLQLVTPDGGKHELSLGNGAASNADADGYMSIFPDGRTRCSDYSYPPSVTGTVVYFTTDGTFLRLEIESDSDAIWENNIWTLYSPDGTRVTNNPVSGSQRIKDRNDNYIDIIENTTDSNYSNHQTTYLKDQLDRKVVIEYNAATDEDWVRSEGVAGEDIITKVKWKSIAADKTYYACFMAQSGTQNANQNHPLNVGLRVADKIYLPEQVGDPYTYDLYYTFGYSIDNTSATDVGWGEVSQVTLPSGAYATYSYSFDNISGFNTSTQTGVHAEDLLENRPVQKELHYQQEYDGASTWVTETTTYTKVGDVITVTSPDGGTTIESYAGGDSTITSGAMEYVKGESLKSVSADGTVVEKVYKANTPTAVYNSPKANRYVKYEFVSPKDASGNYPKTAINEYSYDKNGNVTEVKEYDYVTYSTVPRNSANLPNGLPSGATPARITKTEYYNDTPDAASTTYTDSESYHLSSSPQFRNAVKSIEIQTGGGTPKSRTEITYDNASTTGNPTVTKVWDSYKGNTTRSYSNPLTSTNSISTSASYNSYGMPTLTTDANGVETTITYGCIDGSTSCTSSPWLANLYPTKTEVASNYSSLKRTSTSVYDFYTGLATTATDVDNSVSTTTTYDDLGRPTKVAAAVGTALEIWTQTEYDDAARRVIVKSDLETKGDGKKIAVQHYDQLGRVRLSRKIENFATEDPTDEADGIKVQTRYKIYSGNSYQLSSNPYRAAHSYDASGEPSMGWTRSKTINTGKHSEVETFSGATLPYPFLTSSYNTSTTGVVTTDMDADRTLVTDQAGKQRISKSNALGQLKDVWEVMSASDSATVSVTFPNQSGIAYGYQTSYTYDPLNNLETVSQGSQTRSFSYSSLSRLLSAANPESGTISYQYDANGNLTKKTDARTVYTDYTYDALNRITQRSYSNEPSGQPTTPTVTYTYDNLTNAKGKLTKVSSDISETRYTAFDIMGRVTASEQRIPFSGTETISTATPRASTYSYNLSGALVEQTYPSGRVVKNVLDSDGELSIVQSKKNSASGYWNYADNFTYTASGAVSSMQLGNWHWESTVFNSRLQATQIALGTTQGATNLLDLDYSYGSSQNNGNIQSQTITVPTVGSNTGFTATQNYTYDSLNRIKDASEAILSTQTWKQTFAYDRYGNRSFNEGSASGNYLTTTLTRGCSTSTYNPNGICSKKSTNPTFTASNNRIVQDQDGDSVNDYLFDSSGNTTKDGNSNTYIYDAENKQIEVKNSSSQTIGQYWYDGDGKRVKKYVPGTGETTIFVYDASGKMVAEYSTIVESTSTAKVSYLTNDHLGSSRINTDQNGAVTARHDYQPFGEEISTSQRILGLGYNSDTVRRKFTGYERDLETDLDFAQARMYSSKLGRFGTCDPILASKEHKVNPQRWNLYVYVVNNPLITIDPDGRKPKKIIDVYIAISEYSKEQVKKLQTAIRKQIKDKNVKINVYGWDQSTTDNMAQSLRSKGRTVIFAGHINGGDGGETGELRSRGDPKTAAYSVVLNDGLLRADGIFIFSNDDYKNINKEPIKAENLFIFSCGLTPDAASQFSSRMQAGGTFVYSDGGDDTGTQINQTIRYAAGTATLIGNGYDAQTTGQALQQYSDYSEAQGVPFQNGDNIVTCVNGKCEEKFHKLKPKP